MPITTKNLIILLSLLACMVNANAQSTSHELGENIFRAFKTDSAFQVPLMRLKKAEVGTFLHAAGVDTTTKKILKYLEKYDENSANFSEECEAIRRDTIDNKLSWSNATIDTIYLKNNDYEVIADSEFVRSAKIEIVFSSGNKAIEYLLLVETMRGLDNRWMVGNLIKLNMRLKTDDDN